MLIVEVACLFVAEDFVGLRDGLEFFVGFCALLVGNLVGVGCKGSLRGGVLVCSIVEMGVCDSAFTLWYAFLISALDAERSIFRTSMHISDLICENAQTRERYRRGRFLPPSSRMRFTSEFVWLEAKQAGWSNKRKWQVS